MMQGTSVARGGLPTASATVQVRTILQQDHLKTELDTTDSAMFRDTDCEYFQDLGLWCSTPVKDDHVPSIDPSKTQEEKSNNIDPQFTQFSRQSWDSVLDANLPKPGQSLYTSTPNDPLSPVDSYLPIDNKFLYPNLDDVKIQTQEPFMDIDSLPVVFDDLAPETNIITQDLFGWTDTTQDTSEYILPFSDTNKTAFINEDSMDLKLATPVIPLEVETNDVVVLDYLMKPSESRHAGLSLDVGARPVWPAPVISTPEVLSCVEQLETFTHPTYTPSPLIDTEPAQVWSALDSLTFETASPATCDSFTESINNLDYSPITPRTESQIESDEDVKISPIRPKKRRHDSDDSDASYSPSAERSSPRKYRRRPNIPIQEMIAALEEAQPATRARRGRPPKRRDSAGSSVTSAGSLATGTDPVEKYREVRDKNNEASKRSRMNRKIKELQMEQLASELQERNKKLQVRATILEDMTKRLKDALMTAILQK